MVHVTVDPFHAGSLAGLREMSRSLELCATPSIRTLRPIEPCARLAILPGSFDPPTAAHLMLAERALSDGYDRVLFLIAARTVGKRGHGMLTEDRLLALRALGGDRFSVGICSHGLYADQARAARTVAEAAEITFLVGSDKVLQIFDHGWYADRDRALDQLFDHARLVVAPRSDQADRLRAVLDAPENARWSSRVSVTRLHPAVGDLSSTRVRGLLRAGADPAGLVPTAVADVLSQTGAFAPPIVVAGEEVEPYEVRRRLIEMVFTMRGPDPDVDLRRLFRIAMSPTDAGTRLRAALERGAVCASEPALDGALVSGL